MARRADKRRRGTREQATFRIGEMPCEYAAREIIPSIRAAVAVSMVEKGVSKYKAATLLGITPAAITNYVSGKRGSRYLEIILSNPEFRVLVEKGGRVLLEDTDPRRKEEVFRSVICAICSRLNKYECHAPYASIARKQGNGGGVGG